MVVLNGPLCETRRVANGGLPQRGIAHTEHLKSRWHAVEVGPNPEEAGYWTNTSTNAAWGVSLYGPNRSWILRN